MEWRGRNPAFPRDKRRTQRRSARARLPRTGWRALTRGAAERVSRTKWLVDALGSAGGRQVRWGPQRG